MPLTPPPKLIFGLLSDRFGRKWPLVAGLFIVSVLSLSCGFVQTYQQFLAVRGLFGIGMGGIWGSASSTSLENIPVEVRGIASGVVHHGYAVGYLIAAGIDLYLVPHTSWRALFWTASCISAFAAVLRSLLPESELFLRARRESQAELGSDKPLQSKTRIFAHEVRHMLKNRWLRWIYAVMLASGLSFLSHGTQDLYPTYLEENKGFTKLSATMAAIIGNCGAVLYVLLGVISETRSVVLISQPI